MSFSGNQVLKGAKTPYDKLTAPQKAVYSRMEKGKEYTAKDLGVVITQMKKLAQSGLIKELPIVYSPGSASLKENTLRRFIKK